MTTDSDKVDRALLGMCSVIRGLLVGAARDEVLTRHRVGEVLCRMRATPHAYGRRCIERIAEEIGTTAATLYRHIAVAEAWTARDLTARMEQTNRYGQPMTWSHLVVLASVSDSATREFLFDACLGDAWSVRELRGHVTRLGERTMGGDQEDKQHVAQAVLREGIDFGIRAAADVTHFTTTIAEQRAAGSVQVDEDLVARAIATFEDLRSRAESALAELTRAGHSEKRLRCPPASASSLYTTAADDDDDNEMSREEPVAEERTASVRKRA